MIGDSTFHAWYDYYTTSEVCQNQLMVRERFVAYYWHLCSGFLLRALYYDVWSPISDGNTARTNYTSTTRYVPGVALHGHLVRPQARPQWDVPTDIAVLTNCRVTQGAEL